MLVSDAVLRAIEAEIAAHAPERGGALLGPRGHPLVTHLVADPGAESSGASWRPSRGLDASVKALERGEGLELKGLVHSHPPGVLEPTAQDRDELAEGLRLNGHMPSYLAPIVARAAGGPIAPHEVALPSGRVAFFAAYRTRGGGAEVRPLRVRVVPLLRDLEAAARALGGGDAEVLVSELEETPVLAGRLRLQGLDLLVLAGDGYPSLPPVVLATPAPGAAPGAGPETEQLHVTWRIQTPEARRLAEALRGALVPPGPFQVAFGPPGGPALTRDADRARRAGWERRLTGEDAEAAAERLRDALFARTGGILSDALRDRSALVAGLGSVGSYVAEQLARSGVGRLALLDPEPVEAANLSRTVYETADVGLLKTDALARRLLRVQPTLRLDLHPRALGELPPAALDGIVRSADLVVAATDDPAAQRTLNRFAYARGRPAMFVGLHAGARGGEVILTVPGRTPCYLCATRTRGGAERAGGGTVSAQVDYGTARLRGEVALGADIQHVSSAAVKLGLSLLVPPGGPAALAGFAEAALAAGTPFLTLSMVPDYWFYPGVFADTPGQGAYQAVWLTPHSSPECPVCGDPAGRVEPLDAPARAPSAEALRKLRDT